MLDKTVRMLKGYRRILRPFGDIRACLICFKYLSAVPGGCLPLFCLEYFGKNQRVGISAGQGNALNRQLRYRQQLRCAGDAVIGKVILRGYAKAGLEEGIQVAPVDADIVCNVRYVNREGIVVLYKLYGLEDIRVLSILKDGGVYVDIPGEDGEELIQEALEQKAVGSC